MKMLHKPQTIMPIEKIISILSYLSMGIIGLVWFLIAKLSGKNLKYFLMYNISQSMVIAIILATALAFLPIQPQTPIFLFFSVNIHKSYFKEI